MKITHGPSPAPTNVWFVPGGQCTKSHCFSGRSCSSMISTHSPASTKKSSWPDSAWYMPDGLPGSSAASVNPVLPKCSGCRSGRSASTRSVLSNPHRPPNASCRTHAASPALTTNHPGVVGASPDPTSSSRASSNIPAPFSRGRYGFSVLAVLRRVELDDDRDLLLVPEEEEFVGRRLHPVRLSQVVVVQESSEAGLGLAMACSEVHAKKRGATRHTYGARTATTHTQLRDESGPQHLY